MHYTLRMCDRRLIIKNICKPAQAVLEPSSKYPALHEHVVVFNVLKALTEQLKQEAAVPPKHVAQEYAQA